MFVESYNYITGTIKEGNTVCIPELDRAKYMTPEYMKHFPAMFNVNNKGATAFLYVGGPASHHSDIRNIKDLSNSGSIVVKGQIGYTAYTVARKLSNVEYMSINANTCASGMYALHDAKRLFNEGFDSVVIYAEDMVEQTQLKLFEQLGIDLLCGDGAAMVHLTKHRTPNSKAKIVDTTWKWNKDSSPMTVSTEGYTKVIEALDTDKVTTVKPHGTGTVQNNLAEAAAIELLGEVNIIAYKSVIGHTQGASALIELCMLIDDEFIGDAVCLASGLGGFYGGCIVRL